MINDLPYQVTNNQPDFTKTSKWFKQAYAAIYKAGGDPSGVLDKFPEDLLDTLVRNGVHLTCEKNL